MLTNTNADHCLTLSCVLVLTFVEALLSQEYLPNIFRAMKHQCCHGNQWVEVLVAKSYLLFAIPWIAAPQGSGLPFPPPGDLPDPGIKPRSPALQADSLPSEPPGKPCEQELPPVLIQDTPQCFSAFQVLFNSSLILL